MAKKEIGKIKESVKDIKSIERIVNLSIHGNWHEISDINVAEKMMEDWRMFLNDKELAEKYKDVIGRSFDDDEFDEDGKYFDVFDFYDTYYITFKDDSELYVEFDVDGNFRIADIRDYEESKGKLAEKWLREFQKDGWNEDIDSLMKEVNSEKKEKGGDVSISKSGKNKLRVCRTMSASELKDITKQLERASEKMATGGEVIGIGEKYYDKKEKMSAEIIKKTRWYC